MKRMLLFVLISLWFGTVGKSQTTQIVQWRDVPQERAYEPMPVICVHGITSDSSNCWAYGVSLLSNYFSNVYFRRAGAGAQLATLKFRRGQKGSVIDY